MSHVELITVARDSGTEAVIGVGSIALLGVMVESRIIFKLIQQLMQSFLVRLSGINISRCSCNASRKLALVVLFVISQGLAQAIPVGLFFEPLKPANGSPQYRQAILVKNIFREITRIKTGSQIRNGFHEIITGITSPLPPEHQEANSGGRGSAYKSADKITHDGN